MRRLKHKRCAWATVILLGFICSVKIYLLVVDFVCELPFEIPLTSSLCNDDTAEFVQCVSVRRTPSDVILINNQWQVFRQDEHETFLHAAFYDDRHFQLNRPSIKILSVGTNTGLQLFCHLWFQNNDSLVYSKQARLFNPSDSGRFISGVFYTTLIYECDLPSWLPMPTHVSLATSSCGKSFAALPIIYPYRGPWQHSFGACIPLSFDNLIPAFTFVEWIELYRMFGVTDFNMYNESLKLDTEQQKVIDYYKRIGILEIRDFHVFLPRFDHKIKALNNFVVLNDCLLRNLHRHRYTVLTDIDEIIVPRMHRNYTELLAYIDQAEGHTEPWQSYTFRNLYYFLDFRPDDSQPYYSRTLRYRTRVAHSRYLFAPKSIIDPRRCLFVFNHWCQVRFNRSPAKWTVDVKPTIAASHHYRRCQYDWCQKSFQTKSQDDFMLLFKEELNQRVRKVQKALDNHKISIV